MKTLSGTQREDIVMIIIFLFLILEVFWSIWESPISPIADSFFFFTFQNVQKNKWVENYSPVYRLFHTYQNTVASFPSSSPVIYTGSFSTTTTLFCQTPRKLPLPFTKL